MSHSWRRSSRLALAVSIFLASASLFAARAAAEPDPPPVTPTAPAQGTSQTQTQGKATGEKVTPAEMQRRFTAMYKEIADLKKQYQGNIPPDAVIQAAGDAKIDMRDPAVTKRISEISGIAISDLQDAQKNASNVPPGTTQPDNGTGSGGPNNKKTGDGDDDEVPSQQIVSNPATQLMNAVDNQNVQSGAPGAVLRRGLDRNAQGDFKGAYQDLGQVVQQGNADSITLTTYGHAAYKLGDLQTAYQAATQALQLDPQNYSAFALQKLSDPSVPHIRLPKSLGELGEDNSAAAAMPAGGPAGQASAALPMGGGSSFFRGPPPSGMTAEQALAAARQAATPGSDAPTRSMQFTRDAGGAMRVRDYSTAVQLASQAISLNPQNAQALNYRAMSFSQMRRYSDAVQDASAALGLAPGNAAVLHTRSWAFSKQQKYKEALQDAETASAQEPSNAFLYQDKALALAGLGDRKGALDALARSAALDPKFAGRYERALQLPQDQDMTLLFEDGGAAAAVAVPSPASRQRRFLRLAVLSAVGGLLIALGVLHVVSASWRDRMRMTVRRVLGPSPAVASADGPAVDSPSMGSFWSQYEVIKEIGLGGMGVVYEATDRSLERRVAVKKMRDEIRLEPQDRQRFVNEARLVAQLHHPNIVDIYGIVEDGMDVYLVFEFVEGRTLQDALKSGGPMDVARARQVLKEMSDAVEHAHGRSIIHRDLKPSNVMITPEGRVKVMDFGIARQAKDAMTRHSMTNTIAGTPPYMAPEQEQGTVRKESDVYALGVCLYEMTTGFLPFSGSGAAMLLNKLNGKLLPASQRNPALPAAFDSVIARALEPDPDKRYHTPAELIAALDALPLPARAG